MTRYLRISDFMGMGTQPFTTIISESDTRDTLESVRVTLMENAAERGVFTICEIREGASDPADASFSFIQEIDVEREKNMAILYYWVRQTMPQVNEGGAILPNPLAPGYPAPLTGKEVERVMEQIASAFDYRPSITVRVDAEDGSTLILKNGEVHLEQ